MHEYVRHGDETKAIGQLVMAFQMMESRLLDITIAMCLPGIQIAITAMASQLSFKKLAHAFSAIVATRSGDPELRQRAQKVAQQLCEIEGQRNKYIHSHYHYREMSINGDRIMRTKHKLSNLRQAYQLEEVWFTTAQIETVIQSMVSVFDDLSDIESALIAKGIITVVEEDAPD